MHGDWNAVTDNTHAFLQ